MPSQYNLIVQVVIQLFFFVAVLVSMRMTYGCRYLKYFEDIDFHVLVGQLLGILWSAYLPTH